MTAKTPRTMSAEREAEIRGYEAHEYFSWFRAIDMRDDLVNEWDAEREVSRKLAEALESQTPSWRNAGCWCSVGYDIEGHGHSEACKLARAALAKYDAKPSADGGSQPEDSKS